MAECANQLGALAGVNHSRARVHALIVPREHGAWGMLLVPLATGGALGLLEAGRIATLPLLVVAALAILWLRTPVESWMGTSALRAQSEDELRIVRRAALILACIAGAATAGIFWGGRNGELLWLGMGSGIAFAAQAGLKKLGRKTRMAAQMVGAIGLTSTAAAAYAVVTGRFDRCALLLWLSNWLFAVNQIQFVQLRIHSARAEGTAAKVAGGRGFLVTQATVALALVAAWRLGALPGLALVAFVPAILRSVVWFLRASGPLVVRRLGWTELAQAVTFGVLLVAGFHWPA